MAINDITTVGMVADTAQPPATFQDLLITVGREVVLSLDTTGNETEFLIGPNFPAVGSVPPGTIFAHTGPIGQPLDLCIVWQGRWVPFYSHTFIGKLAWFVGFPDTFFSDNGFGREGTRWFGWARANGLNGTTNLQFSVLGIASFLVPGYRSDGGGQGRGVANFFEASLPLSINSPVAPNGDQYSGGLQTLIVTPFTLPSMSIDFPFSSRFETITGSNHASQGPECFINSLTLNSLGQPVPPIRGNLELFPMELTGDPRLAEPIPIFPPYRALGLCEFIGY